MARRKTKAMLEREALRRKWGLHTTDHPISHEKLFHAMGIPRRAMEVLEAQWDVGLIHFQEGVAILTENSLTGSWTVRAKITHGLGGEEVEHIRVKWNQDWRFWLPVK